MSLDQALSLTDGSQIQRIVINDSQGVWVAGGSRQMNEPIF